MTNTPHNLQRYIHHILNSANAILKKYPDIIPNPSETNEERISWINDQIGIIWENLKYTPFNSDFTKIKNARNIVNHKQSPLSPEENKALWSAVFPLLPELKKKLESKLQPDSNSKKRRFAKFGPSQCGTEAQRQQLVDALDDSCNCEIAKDDKVPFPENELSNAVQSIIHETIEPNESYITAHNGLNRTIQKDILDWIKTVNDKINIENPFEKEIAFTSQIEQKSSTEIVNTLDEIQSKYTQISNGKIDFDFYRKELKKASVEPDESRIRKEKAIASLIVENMKTDCFQRKLKWEIEEIEKMRREFVRRLYENIEKFKKLEKSISAFFDEPGILWDLSKGYFRESDFSILNKYADLLENDEGLKELSDLIGKQNRLQKEYEIELRSKTVIKTEYHPKTAYKGQICGIKTSNDISSVLPSELALYHHPSTKKLFELKYVQKQLLSFKYENLIPEEKNETEVEEISKEKVIPKGPVIICIDTSGSMHGAPENIAKTITFALTKIALKEHRKCYLISFSTEIQTLSLSDGGKTKISPMENLLQFLRMSFNGGTDAAPALNHALKMLNEDDYRNADVLMISDFIMSELEEDVIQQIEREKEKKTDFYSLVIGDSQNPNVIQSFNHNWYYDLTDRNAQKKLVEIVNTMR